MVHFNLKAIYYTDEHKVLCFTCAVKEAMKGKEVDTTIDDYSSEYDMRSTQCEICGKWING